MATMGQNVATSAVIVQRGPHVTFMGCVCSVVRMVGLEPNVMVCQTRFYLKIHIRTNTTCSYGPL